MAKYEVIDNFLPEHEFEAVRAVLCGSDFNWFYNPFVTFSQEPSERNDPRFCYFTHKLFDNLTKSHWFDQVVPPIINRLEAKSLIRAKANLYPRTEGVLHHLPHTDYDFHNRAAILYINTNDGLTVIDGEGEVESVANRVLLFEGSMPHHSTTCTDQKTRININFNFF